MFPHRQINGEWWWAPTLHATRKQFVGRMNGSDRLVGWVESPPCGKPYNSRDTCGRIDGHPGHHWPCSPELMAEGQGLALGYLSRTRPPVPGVPDT